MKSFFVIALICTSALFATNAYAENSMLRMLQQQTCDQSGQVAIDTCIRDKALKIQQDAISSQQKNDIQATCTFTAQFYQAIAACSKTCTDVFQQQLAACNQALPAFDNLCKDKGLGTCNSLFNSATTTTIPVVLMVVLMTLSQLLL